MTALYKVLTDRQNNCTHFALHPYLDLKSHLRDMVYHTSLVALLFLLLNNEKRCLL